MMTPYDLDRIKTETHRRLVYGELTEAEASYALLRALIEHAHDLECDRQLALHHEREAGCNHWPGQARCEVCGMGRAD